MWFKWYVWRFMIRRIGINFIVIWWLMFWNICFDFIFNISRFMRKWRKDYVFKQQHVGIEIWKLVYISQFSLSLRTSRSECKEWVYLNIFNIFRICEILFWITGYKNMLFKWYVLKNRWEDDFKSMVKIIYIQYTFNTLNIEKQK